MDLDNKKSILLKSILQKHRAQFREQQLISLAKRVAKRLEYNRRLHHCKSFLDKANLIRERVSDMMELSRISMDEKWKLIQTQKEETKKVLSLRLI